MIRSGRKAARLRPSALILTLTAILMLPATRADAASPSPFDNMMPNARFSGCFDGQAVEGNGGPCRTDNRSVYWWMERPIDETVGTDSRAEEQINVSMARDFGSTDLNTYFDSTPVFGGAAETDVIYRHRVEDFRDARTVGYYWCDDVAGLSSSNQCDQGYINLRYIENTPAQMRALICHETGHAVGLLHPTDSVPFKERDDTRFACMMNAPIAAFYGLGPDPNVRNINATY